jgi:hypothetical protein
MLKTAGRESQNPALNHYENLVLNFSFTGLKKALPGIIFAGTMLSCQAVEHNAPTNSSDISFRDLFVSNCLSYSYNLK